jgi:hypothetical protein
MDLGAFEAELGGNLRPGPELRRERAEPGGHPSLGILAVERPGHGPLPRHEPLPEMQVLPGPIRDGVGQDLADAQRHRGGFPGRSGSGYRVKLTPANR